MGPSSGRRALQARRAAGGPAPDQRTHSPAMSSSGHARLRVGTCRLCSRGIGHARGAKARAQRHGRL
eukprot:5381120-Lingulodinium_polyedra.AAC.1